MSGLQPADLAYGAGPVSDSDEYSDESEESDSSDDSGDSDEDFGHVEEEDLANKLKDDVEVWINKADYIPKDIGYDWHPFCAALIDNHRDTRGVFQPPSSATPSSSLGGAGGSGGNRGHVFFGRDPGDLAPRKGEGWKHIRYVPAWMDPDYRDDFLPTPSGKLRRNTSSTRDAMYNLRPALRLADAIRNPTDYALRYGMIAGRLDGRSRMSPTWSKTRNPVDDNNGIKSRFPARKFSRKSWNSCCRSTAC